MKNPGRFTGLIYLIVSIPAVFTLIYVPSKLIIRGDPSATAANIAAHETLFRLGIGAEIVSQIAFIWVALLLYDLLKQTNRREAQWMFGLIALPLPLVLLNELNALAALTLIRGAAYIGPSLLTTLSQPERESLAMFFLKLHNSGFDIAGIFWGLWLFPLGLLVYRSPLFPRIVGRSLGALLIANCCSYVIDSLTSIVVPQYDHIVSQWTMPLISES